MKFHNRFTTGFTLIEILVVLFIISIVTTAALLSFRYNENKQLESFANELVQMLSLAEEQAILQPKVLGLRFRNQSFQFQSYENDAQGKQKVWVPFEDAILGTRTIPNTIQVEVKMKNRLVEKKEEEVNSPQIIISNNGDLSPFIIYIGKRGQKPSYAIVGESDGNISSQVLS